MASKPTGNGIIVSQLHAMDGQLSALIEIADGQGDHLLAALLCEAQDRVKDRYADLMQD